MVKLLYYESIPNKGGVLMSDAVDIQSTIDEMAKKLAYIPYEVSDNKVICRSCKNVVEDTSKLTETHTVKDKWNKDVTVHYCPKCRYVNIRNGREAVNVQLKKRIVNLRDKIGLSELDIGSKFRNQYIIPNDEYAYTMFDYDSNKNIVVQLSEDDLIKGVSEVFEGLGVESDTVEEEVNYDAESDRSIEEVDEFDNENADQDNIDNLDVDNDDIDNNIESEVIEESKIIDDKSKDFEDSISINEVEDENNIESDGDDIEDIKIDDSDNVIDGEDDINSINDSDIDTGEKFESDDASVEDEIDPLDNDSVKDISLDDMIDQFKSKDEDDMNIYDTSDSDDDSDSELLDFFKTSSDNKSDTISSQSTPRNTGGVSDIHYEFDSYIDSSINANKKEADEIAESDIFDLDNRPYADRIGGVIQSSSNKALLNDFNVSNAKTVIDRLDELCNNSNMNIKHHLTIDNELTLDIPVVDFEGNLRLIFVDNETVVPNFEASQAIARRLRPRYDKDAKYHLQSIVVYVDQIMTNFGINRVVKAVFKNLVFLNRAKNVIPNVSIINDSDGYYYTTDKMDSRSLKSFDKANNAGNVDKFQPSSLAIVSRYINKNRSPEWYQRKDINNRMTFARGGEINYEDLMMYMSCMINYVELPNKNPDGSITVLITNYIEPLDLFAVDGFEVIIGVLTYLLQAKNPTRINMYIEIDPTMIPSPTLSKYINSNEIRDIRVDEDDLMLNRINKIISKHNNTIPTPITVESSVFNSSDLNAPYLKLYQLSPEVRRQESDFKRVDERKFAKRSFANTLGDRFDSYKNSIDINDKSARLMVMGKVGYKPIYQPPLVMRGVIEPSLYLRAMNKVMQTCNGVFSLATYSSMNKSNVIDDRYVENMQHNQQQYYQQNGYGYQQNQYPPNQFGGFYPNNGAYPGQYHY